MPPCGWFGFALSTAATFDVISAQGDFLGGAIAPGLMISAEALSSAASRLFLVDLTPPRSALGKNTIENMQSGIIYGYVGLVDGMVERLVKEMGYPCTVLATGGLAPLIRAESTTIDEVDEFITLEGLRILYERNRS